MKFLVDINVGKLAKLLRMLGYDAFLFRGDNDEDMVFRALFEGRIILTKDRNILRRRIVTTRGLKALLIKSTNPDDQLKEVAQKFSLNPSASFTRCLECNSLLEPCFKEEVKGLIPPYVYQTQEDFKRCPSCHKIYWKGTHWQRMVERLKGALEVIK